MPIFEYKCNSCGKTFENLELPGQKNNVMCTGCGSDDLKKLISAPFLPSSVGKPANDEIRCCGSNARPKECTSSSCCGLQPE